MKLSEKIDKLNRSKNAQAWTFTILSYVFSYLVLSPYNPFSGTPYSTLSYVVIPIAAVLTYLRIKSWVTGEDVWSGIDFGLVNSEEDLHEGATTKKVKGVLKNILLIGSILLLVAIAISVIISVVFVSPV